MRAIVEDPDSSDHRRILLDAALHGMSEDTVLATTVAKGETVEAALQGEADLQWVEHTLRVDYGYWTANHVLRVRRWIGNHLHIYQCCRV